MVKIIKSYKLGTAQDAQVTAKRSKGTVSTPFTQQEYNQLTQAGEWTGGYVKGEGELYTRAMNILGPFYGAADYSIYYGIHD